ncbi:MAG: dienelactone hydrolase family protein [Gammaproteobacteria bacterium]|nr:dienelactone hydrolase family protein [Gammaproteobacteria bacterium]
MSNVEGSALKYQVDGGTHVGFFACDADAEGPRPGVIVVHEWWGCNDFVRERARRLAEAGYAAFAVDMFGGGATADRPDQAAALMNGVLQDMETGTRRLRTAYDVLLERPEVDGGRTAAIGYCFGGAMVLHMARIGMPLKAVVSFHGSLGSFHKPKPGSVKPRILICHGGGDKMVSMDDLESFRKEMDEARADYEVIVYDGALHGFTNPQATERGQKYGLPLAHDAEADAASWKAMLGLFEKAL